MELLGFAPKMDMTCHLRESVKDYDLLSKSVKYCDALYDYLH